MISRTTLTFLTGGACGALVATLLQGPVVPASLLSEQQPDAEVEQAERAVTRKVQTRSPDAPVGEETPEAHIEALEALVEELETELHRERHGVPTVWDFDPPKGYGPDDYADTIESIIDDCPDYEGRVLAHDCSEPPCMTLYDGGPPMSCPGWDVHYNDWQATSTGKLDCPDGRKVPYVLQGPSMGPAMSGVPADEFWEYITHTPKEERWELTTEVPTNDAFNGTKRMDWRVKKHTALICGE